MKEKRIISEEEKEILVNSKIRSFWSLGRLFYIMALLLPFFVCILITKYYVYLLCFFILLGLFVFYVIIYPKLFKYYLKTNNIYAYDSKILSCRKSEIYYYLVEVEDIKGDFLDHRFPVFKRLKKDQDVIVIMVMGENKYLKYYLMDKKTKTILTSKRTRFDLID